MKKTRFLVLTILILTMGIASCNGGNSNSQSSASVSSSTQEPSSSSSPAPSTSSASTSSSSQESSSSSISSSSIHVHVYGDLVNGYLPSYYYDGMQDYYRCAECGQYFDVNKNPVSEDSLKLPKAGDNIAISINDVEKGTFTLLEKQESSVAWKYTGLTVEVGDVVTLTKPGDSTYKYGYFGGGNVDKDGKILTAGTVDLDLVATPNGFQLGVSGYKYPGLVVKVNDDEYPLTKVSYYEENKETYIYGYHYFNVNDVMTVVDNVNNVVYDYEDLENDTKWDTFDFHKGTNNEIVFDYQGRFGIEFDRAGDKLISITKAFAPNDGNAFQVNFSSDKAAVDLEKMVIDDKHELYDEMAWYLNHEVVINNLDIKDYVSTHGFVAYQAIISFAKNEMFNLKNVTNNSIIKGEHLTSIFNESANDFVSISGDYIKVLEDASIMVFYIPSYDAISLYHIGAPTSGAYIYFGGNIIPAEINNNTIEYNNFHAEQYDTIAFADGQHQGIEFTLASGYDSSVLFASTANGMTTLMFYKAGTFSVSLDLSTHILTVTIIELDSATEVSVPKYLSGKGGLYKTLVENPENSDEVYASNVTISGASDGFYIAFYDTSMNSVEGISLDADSSAYGTVMLEKMIYIIQDGTYNIYIHKTSHVVRLVKTA